MDISNKSPHAIEPHRNGKNGHFDRRLFQIGGLKFDSPVSPPKLVGSELTSADFASLEARWIDRQFAESAFLRRVNSFSGSQLVGRKGGDYAGIAIPYFAPGSQHVREYRLRRDHADFEANVNGELRALIRR